MHTSAGAWLAESSSGGPCVAWPDVDVAVARVDIVEEGGQTHSEDFNGEEDDMEAETQGELLTFRKHAAIGRQSKYLSLLAIPRRHGSAWKPCRWVTARESRIPSLALTCACFVLRARDGFGHIFWASCKSSLRPIP